MDRIKIYKKDEVSFLTLPKTRQISFLNEVVAYETTMASGRIVQDIVGYRSIIKVQLDYVPADLLAALVVLLRAGGFFKVEYPAPDGTVQSGLFKVVDKSGQKVFRFRRGEPFWYGVELEMTSQAVSTA